MPCRKQTTSVELVACQMAIDTIGTAPNAGKYLFLSRLLNLFGTTVLLLQVGKQKTPSCGNPGEIP